MHERHDRTRSTSKTFTVDRQALIHILMDHARMLEVLRKTGRIGVAELGRSRWLAPGAGGRKRQRAEGGVSDGFWRFGE